jgi:regulator of RNase E activity RraA
MNLWENDAQLFAIAHEELFTAVVGDVMDKLKLLHQFLPSAIKPIHREMVAIGRAMPVLEADYFEEISETGQNPISRKPFGLMFEALDSLQVGEIYICTGSSPTYALWGELMSCRAIYCGAAGAILDGPSRDTRGILDLKFPTFARGTYAQDQGARGKVLDFRIPIEIEGVRINPGDILFADEDGVLVVPKAAEEEVFRRAIEKARKEKTVRKAIEAGMTARQAFDEFGIL